ncbi:secreted RxLR effector protein 161-like [Diospyros lotus]|uniref:secreted RxLR effector protein 161-like n=1 Tax=Diospyros lotus TaxID=55363 RepID=UPI002258C5D2|nr:secreted RxLR effector protein 161-like [Diospyros lotus]
MSPNTPEERDRMSKIPYALAFGNLLYAMICTRSDIAYTISVVSQYQSDPGESHWIAVKHILKYLRRTKDMLLIYGMGDFHVDGFIGLDFQSDVNDSKSMSGFLYLLNGSVVSWKSSKQTTTTNSTTETEYLMACDATKEAVWILKFLSEVDVVPTTLSPIPLYYDNNGVIAQAKELGSH